MPAVSGITLYSKQWVDGLVENKALFLVSRMRIKGSSSVAEGWPQRTNDAHSHRCDAHKGNGKICFPSPLSLICRKPVNASVKIEK